MEKTKLLKVSEETYNLLKQLKEKKKKKATQFEKVTNNTIIYSALKNLRID